MDNIRESRRNSKFKHLFYIELCTHMYFYNIDVLGVVLHAFYIHDPCLELFIRHNGPVFDPRFVGIDRID